MSLSSDTVEEVRRRALITEVVQDSVTLRRQGSRLVGLCPFHDESTPSFSVNADRGLFYCFGCQAGGDVFAFVMKRDSLTFPEAVRMLAERYGVPIRELDPKREAFREAGYRVLEAACAFFEGMLAKDDGVKAYLKERGVLPATREAFRLGFAPDAAQALYRHLRQKNFTDAIMSQTGLVTKGRGGAPLDRFRARLMFPIRDRQGRVVAFGGRLIDDRQGPKYLNSSDTPFFKKGTVLYDLPSARRAWTKTRRGVLVEGYMDVLALAQAGIEGAVASLGTALTPEQVQILGREIDELVVAYDGDLAGRGAALRGLWLLAATGIQSRFLRLPPDEDPASLLAKGGVERWKEQEGRALRLVDFLTEATLSGIDVSTPKGKARAVKAILPGILMLQSGVEQDEEIRRLTQRLGIDEAVLRREVQPKGAFRKREARVPDTGTSNSLRHRIEMSIIKLLAEDPAVVEHLVHRGVEFRLPGANEVYQEIAAGRDPNALESDEARRLWSRAQVEEGPAEDPEELLKAWDREGKRERLKELKEDIRRRERNGENVPTELLEEVQKLSHEG